MARIVTRRRTFGRNPVTDLREVTVQPRDKWSLAYEAHLRRFGSPEAAREWADQVAGRTENPVTLGERGWRSLERTWKEYPRSDRAVHWPLGERDAIQIMHEASRAAGEEYMSFRTGEGQYGVGPRAWVMAALKEDMFGGARERVGGLRNPRSSFYVITYAPFNLVREAGVFEDKQQAQKWARQANRIDPRYRGRGLKVERADESGFPIKWRKPNPFSASLVEGIGTGTGLAIAAGVAGPFLVRRIQKAARKVGLRNPQRIYLEGFDKGRRFDVGTVYEDLKTVLDHLRKEGFQILSQEKLDTSGTTRLVVGRGSYRSGGKRGNPRRRILDEVMAEHILMPGAPQMVVTRSFAYEWLRGMGLDDLELDSVVMSKKAVMAPLTPVWERERMMDAIAEDFMRSGS